MNEAVALVGIACSFVIGGAYWLVQRLLINEEFVLRFR
jgi:hypothetical protein